MVFGGSCFFITSLRVQFACNLQSSSTCTGFRNWKLKWFFSLCVFWIRELEKIEKYCVCVCVCVFTCILCALPVSCSTKKLESGIRKTGWCAGEDQWICEVHWWQMAGFILWRSDRGGGEPAVSELQDECIGSTALCRRSNPVPAEAGGYKGQRLGSWEEVVREGRSVIKRWEVVPVPSTFSRVLTIRKTGSHKMMKWAWGNLQQNQIREALIAELMLRIVTAV